MKRKDGLLTVAALATFGFGILAEPLCQAQFTWTTNAGAITITGYTGPGGAVIIPHDINGLPVTDINTYAFLQHFEVTSVSIPEGVTNIGSGAFDNCGNLTSVTIPASVRTIEYQAFIECRSLTNVIIPSGVQSIEQAVFSDCSSLTDVYIPNSVTNIGGEAFEFCVSLASISIPDSVKSLEDQCFGFCTSLTNVSIPSSVNQIAGSSFYGSSSLEAFFVDSQNPFYTSRDGVLFSKDLSLLVVCPGSKSGTYAIPSGVKNIGEFAFAICGNITNLSIPDGVTNLGYWSFSSCGSISRITIPRSVKYIDDLAFQQCTSLREVYFQGDAPTVSGFGASLFIGDPVNLYYLPGTTGWDAFFGFLNLFGTLWNPTVGSNDQGFGLRTNEFSFNITGTTNIPLVVEASISLTTPLWVPLQSCTLTNGSLYFADPEWSNYPSRFYRIRSP